MFVVVVVFPVIVFVVFIYFAHNAKSFVGYTIESVSLHRI